MIHLYKDKSNHKYVEANVKETPRPTKTFPRVHLSADSGTKCERNESTANMAGFSELPAHTQDFLFYRHCRHFPLLLDSPGKCGGPENSHQVFLLLVIKSSPENFDRREALRKTWARERQHHGLWIRTVFISGKAAGGVEGARLDKLLQVEQDVYRDVLQWDFEDSFSNLTLKQVLFLQWMERNCPNARFLLNGDDDIFANTDNMVQYLRGLEDNDGGKHLFIGHLMEGVEPIREPESKYFVPVQLHGSGSYPSYCSGGGFLLSGYTASVVYDMSKSIDLLPIDDVYMGMCLAKAGLRPESHQGMKPFGLQVSSKVEDYDVCFYREILLVHCFLPFEMFVIWHRIQDLELGCSGAVPKKTNP